MSQEVSAKLRYLRIAPKKVRLVARVLKGMPIDRAEAELRARAKRGAPALLELLKSATANAVNVKHLERQSLLVKNVLVNPGPPLKRILPRARGSASPLWKRTSHVTLILESREGLKIAPPKIIRPEMPKAEAPVAEVEKIERPKAPKREKPVKKATRGFVPKFFQRKAV